MPLIFKWVIGLSLSLIAGHFVSRWFRNFRTQHIKEAVNDSEAIKKQQKEQISSNLLPKVTGLIERTFFTLIVAFDVSGGAVAMIAWLGAKMAVNWNRQSGDNSVVNRALSMTALQTGMVSLLFALIGGLICKW